MATANTLFDRSMFRAYVKIKDKYYVIGERASEGTLAYGITQEEKNSITNKTAFKTAKAGSYSLPITTELDGKNNSSMKFVIETIKKNINKEYKILLVYEFLHVKSQAKQYIAENFNAIIPIETLGGSGQSPNSITFTIGNAGDIKLGYVDVSEEGSKYDAGTDTYKEDAFTEDADVEIEEDPENDMTMPVPEDSVQSSELGGGV